MGKNNANNFIVSQEDTPGSGTYTQVAFITTNDMARANAPIDVTNKTDGVDRCLIPGGQRSMDISCEGIASDDATLTKLWNLVESNDNSANFRITHADENLTVVRTWTAKFFIANMDHSGAINEALGFSCTLQSSGTVAVVTP